MTERPGVIKLNRFMIYLSIGGYTGCLIGQSAVSYQQF
jgi:hypothetical protein